MTATADQTQFDSQRVLDLYRRHVSRGRAKVAAFTGGAVELASSGSSVIDQAGRELLDCGGYGVFILGHRHPRVTEAVVSQIYRHPMSTRLLLEPTLALAAEAVAKVTPDGLDYVHFVNSGAEATEAAIKLARANGKRHLISMRGGYHGKTMGALTLTARALYQEPFQPLLPDVQHVEFGSADKLEAALAVRPDACVVVEPVQGEGGVVLPPPGYLTAVEALCRRHSAMFVLDEIQTGLGRLGYWWGADLEGVQPDILLVGKGLSGGVVPVAAMVATSEAYAPFNRDPLQHTSTFAGSPVAMAAAKATIETIQDEAVVERARDLGHHLLTGIRALLQRHCPQLVTDVRGLGLLIGLEFRDEETAGEFMLALLERRVLVNHSLNAHRVIRLTPPVTLSADEVGWLFGAVEDSAVALANRRRNT